MSVLKKHTTSYDFLSGGGPIQGVQTHSAPPMVQPIGIALHSFISGTPRAPWVPMEAPSGCGMARNGVSGRLHPGAGWPETGFQVAAHPGARWPETPNSRDFWPSRTRKPRFSGGELVEAKCIVLYFSRLCSIFLRFCMLLATGPGHLISAFSRIPKT